MATGRVPTTANSPLTAKGDLFGYSTAPERLAVGNDGEQIVADSSTSTGLRWQGSIAAGRNFAINGGLDIWQRGTSFTTSGYSADRWNTSSTSVTISRQSTNAPVGSQYYLRNTATAGSAASDSFMYFESSQTAPLVGRTITISVKVRRNATFNADVFFRLDKSATVDAGSGATWTNIVPTSGSDGTSNSTPNASITTGTGVADWTTIYRTIAIPSDGTANSLRVILYYGNAVPSGSVLEIAQLQVEIGSIPTSFSRAGGTIQGELAACQRYYTRFTPGAAYGGYGIGYVTGATDIGVMINLPVQMRIVASSIDYSSGLAFQTFAGSFITPSSISLSSVRSPNQATIDLAVTGATSGQVGRLLNNNNATGFVGFNAEL